MPELPEVETICRGLRPLLSGRRVCRVDVRQERLRSRVARGTHALLQGKTVLGVARRGKYIQIQLEGEAVWLLHLGMSGKLIYVSVERPKERHDHIIARLDNGHELRYHDPRRFGLSLVTTRAALDGCAQWKNLGLEPFDRRFNGAYLYDAARASSRRIRDLLIDQRVVAGLGNIYANEILFRAGVRPTTRAWRLSRARVERIAQTTPRVLREAIRWCGTSFSDYRDAEDRYGKFQNHLRVYGREGENCRACPGKIKRVVIGSRSAWYCPACQR